MTYKELYYREVMNQIWDDVCNWTITLSDLKSMTVADLEREFDGINFYYQDYTRDEIIKMYYKTVQDVAEGLELVEFGHITSYMNDEIRESLHAEMAPCSKYEFLRQYLKRDPDFVNLLKTEHFEHWLDMI